MSTYKDGKEVYICDNEKDLEAKIKSLSKSMKRFTAITVNRLTITAYLAPEFN